MSIQAATYIKRPKFEPDDFIISKQQNETRYIPSSLVPSQIEAKCWHNRIEFHFTYDNPEPPSASAPNSVPGVELVSGKYTRKILRISIGFDPNFSGLIHGIDDAMKAVMQAKAFALKNSVQKSYDLVVSFLQQAKADIRADEKNLSQHVFTQPAQANS